MDGGEIRKPCLRTDTGKFGKITPISLGEVNEKEEKIGLGAMIDVDVGIHSFEDVQVIAYLNVAQF